MITLSVFVPFTLLYMRESLDVDYPWAGLCLLGAIYFIFRSAAAFQINTAETADYSGEDFSAVIRRMENLAS